MKVRAIPSKIDRTRAQHASRWCSVRFLHDRAIYERPVFPLQLSLKRHVGNHSNPERQAPQFIAYPFFVHAMLDLEAAEVLHGRDPIAWRTSISQRNECVYRDCLLQCRSTFLDKDWQNIKMSSQVVDFLFFLTAAAFFFIDQMKKARVLGDCNVFAICVVSVTSR